MTLTAQLTVAGEGLTVMPTLKAADLPRLVRGLQERTAQALPAVVVDRLDGWWLRHADSAAWWTSAVPPHGGAAPSLVPNKIDFAEHFYAEHGTPTRFQVRC